MMRIQYGRVVRVVAMIGIGLAVATRTFGQTQPDESLPGFKPGNLYESRGIDDINLFSGDPNITVPLGPEYTLGPGSKWQLRAHYSAKFWFKDSNCTDGSPVVLHYKHSRVTGYPTLGAGWTLELGYVFAKAKNDPAFGVTYVSPDGQRHTVLLPDGTASAVTTDQSKLRITRFPTSGPITSYSVEFPDGTIQYFQHAYFAPTNESGSSPDFKDQAFDDDNPASQRFGLSFEKDRFNTTLRQVAYKTDDPTKADCWKVDHITLTPVSNPRTIQYSWLTLKIIDSNNGNPKWAILSSISFPAATAAPLVVSFAFEPGSGQTLSTLPRNGYDEGVGSSSSRCSSPATAAVPLLDSIAFKSGSATLATYSFNYLVPSPADSPTYRDRALSRVTLPTGGTIDYTYGKTAISCVFAPCADPETGDMASGGAAPVNPPNGNAQSFPFQSFVDSTAAVISRTETDVTSGQASTVNYHRYQYGPVQLGGGDPEGDTLHMARSVLVTRPSGNGSNTLTTRYLFHTSDSGSTGGIELEQRHYPENDPGSGTPVRSIIHCYQGDQATLCGLKDTSGNLLAYDGPSGIGLNFRKQGTVTWYGVNPDGGGDCSQDNVPCLQDVMEPTSYDSDSGQFRVETVSSSLLTTMPGWSSRVTTTDWDALTSPNHWILNLFDSKQVADNGSGLPNPTSITSNFSFDRTQYYGFLQNLSTCDGGTPSTCASGVTLTTSYTPDSGGSGNPTAITRSSSGGGLDGVSFTDTLSYLNGLVLTSQRTAPAPGVPWMSFSVARDLDTGLISTSNDPNNLSTQYSYDGLSRLATITPPGGEVPTTISYDSPTQTTVKRTVSGVDLTHSRIIYDSLGRISREIRQMPSGFAVKVHTYDAAGHANFVSEWGSCASEAGTCTTTIPPGTTLSNFDPFDRPMHIVRADGKTSDIDRTDGSISFSDTLESVTVNNVGGSQATTITRKDALGRVISVIEPDAGSGTDETDYTYNVLDKLAVVTQGSQVRTFNYDSFGYLRSETNPEKGPTTYSTYDASGNLRSKSEGGNTYSYAYDPAGRLKTEDVSGVPYLMNCWDGSQTPCPDGSANASATNPFAHLTRRYGYNPAFPTIPTVAEDLQYNAATGRMSQRTTTVSSSASNPLPLTTTESWVYNNLGLLGSYTHPHAAADPGIDSTYTYSAGLPTGLSTNSGTQTLVSNVSYNPAGGLSGWRAGTSGLTTTISPDSMNRPLSISTSNSAFSTGSFTYDGAGNITNIGSDTFGYDRRSRLTSSTVIGNSKTYGYDRFGNMQSAGAVDPATNRLSGAIYDNAQPGGLGNLTSFGAHTYEYDPLSRQLSLDSGVETYLYNGSDERIARIPASGGLLSLSVSPSTVASNGVSVCTVTLAANAPTGGATVALSSSNGAVVPVPPSVTINAGSSSTTFSINVGTVASITSAVITGNYNGTNQTATLTVTPPIQLVSVAVSPTSLIGGNPSNGTVTLSGNAPTGGITVGLSSSNFSVASTPASAFIPAGSSTAGFTINTSPVSSTTNVTITASYLGTNKTATLAVNPPALSSITLNPTVVTGTATSAGTLTLTGAAVGGTSISLSSTVSPVGAATIAISPNPVVFAANATQATFTVSTSNVTAANTTTISGTYNGTKTATLTVNLSGPCTTPTVSSLTISPGSTVGGTTPKSNGTVTLCGVPTTNQVVTLVSGNTAVATVPASVTVAANANPPTATFQITTVAVTTSTNVSITASLNSTSQPATITVNPPTLSSVSMSPPSVQGGVANSIGTVTLTGPVATGASVVVSLVSTNTGAATVPASVSIGAGQSANTFTATSHSVPADTTTTIQATYLGVTKTATLAVTHAAVSTVATISFSPNPVNGGSPSTGTVTLTAPAPAGGLTISLTSNNSAVASVPSSVPAAQNATSVTFPVTTFAVSSQSFPLITATSGSSSVATTLTVNPIIALTSLSVSPTTVTAGTSASGTVNLSNSVFSPVVITLSSNNAAATVPASIQISSGSSGGFTITTSSVSVPTTVTITATYNGVNKTATITINPNVQLSSLGLSPNPIVGGGAVTGTVTMTFNAYQTTTVNLTSSNPSLIPVPPSVNVAIGSNSQTFIVNTAVVCSNSTVTITATFNGVSKPQVLTINVIPPATLTSLSVSPSSIQGGDIATGTVGLSGPAPCGGVTVALSSSRTTVADVDPSVTVPQGQTSATFTVFAGTPLKISQAIISGVYAGVTKTFTVSVFGAALAPNQSVAAINPASPWYVTFRDDSYRLSTEYTLPVSSVPALRTKDYFYFGNLLVASQDNNCGQKYYVSDHLGTPRYIHDGNGSNAESHTYQPYGEEISNDTSCTPSLQFCEMERDQASGNDYDHVRFVLPGVDRFLSPDPTVAKHAVETPLAWNRYSYVRNNPVRYSDPDGLDVVVLGEAVDKLRALYHIQHLIRNLAARKSLTLNLGTGELSVSGMSVEKFASLGGNAARNLGALMVSTQTTQIDIHQDPSAALSGENPSFTEPPSFSSPATVHINESAFPGFYGGVAQTVESALAHELFGHGIQFAFGLKPEATQSFAGSVSPFNMLIRGVGSNEPFAVWAENNWRLEQGAYEKRSYYKNPGDIELP